MVLFWVVFNVFVVGMLALDLGVLQRGSRRLGLREALAWSALWFLAAGLFAGVVLVWQGHGSALQFVTGYVIELSLSVDNLFVFLVIFRFFKVPEEHQHRVLFLGILGALLIRGLFILAGVNLLRRFAWISYAFGILLVISGIRLFGQGAAKMRPERSPMLRVFPGVLRHILPVTEEYHGGDFFIWQDGLYATPLLLVLLVIETSDILFAVDSIPAVLAITANAFIVYTSNVFAILGLRSMYFALAGMMDLFHYLHYGLSLVLIFIGCKMLVAHSVEIPTVWTLVTVVSILAVSVLASVRDAKRRASAAD